MSTSVAPISLVTIQGCHVISAWLRTLSSAIADSLAVINPMQAQADGSSPPATWAPLAPMTSHGRCCRVLIGSYVPHAKPRNAWKSGPVHKPVPHPLTLRDRPETHILRLFWGADSWIEPLVILSGDSSVTGPRTGFPSLLLHFPASHSSHIILPN